MLEDPQAKGPQGQRRQGGIKRTDEIFIEPLCFLDLEADSLDRGKLFWWKIDNETDTEVIEP